MASKNQKPGEKAQSSGQYRPARGGDEITVPKGHRLPPGPTKGTTWKLVDRSKNQSGR